MSAREFLLDQWARHPAARLQDLRKALYQSTFGCGHLVDDPSAAADWIRREAEHAPDCREMEPLDGPWCRVPLGILSEGLTPETLAAAFAQSAAVPGEDIPALEDRLAVLMGLIREGTLPFDPAAAAAEIAAWRAAGFPACHHSEDYRNAYHPAYRVLHRHYTRLLPLLETIDGALAAQERVLLAIEGGAAGGKGASLCRMSRAGLPVPTGFIVRSEMFNAFMEANGLWDYVYEKLAEIDFTSDASLISVAAKIRQRIIDSPVPEEMACDIVKYYTQIGTGREPVAVRSSGTAEDLDDASFAGQQETFLFVIGNDDVVKYIKECWASLYNDRAIFYRREKKFDERSISIAVVVQRMVSAQKAGVMFTSNPITNDHDTVVLEAAWGLGEAIVSGIVTPDNLWINKHTGEITTE